jgi:hypothetical protein
VLWHIVAKGRMREGAAEGKVVLVGGGVNLVKSVAEGKVVLVGRGVDLVKSAATFRQCQWDGMRHQLWLRTCRPIILCSRGSLAGARNLALHAPSSVSGVTTSGPDCSEGGIHPSPPDMFLLGGLHMKEFVLGAKLTSSQEHPSLRMACQL